MKPNRPLTQWRELRQHHPASWPRVAQCALALLCFAMPLLIGWQGHLASSRTQLQQARQQEQQQQALYQSKWLQAAILPALQTRKQWLEQGIEQSREQLFDNADAAILLREVATLSTACQLILEHAQPGTPVAQESHVIWPLHLRLRGQYHQMGCFAAATAAASHPLTLANLQLSNNANDADQLSLEAALLIYRRRDQEQPS